jgi:hypothetical protein
MLTEEHVDDLEEPGDDLHPLADGVLDHDLQLLPPDVGDAPAERAGAAGAIAARDIAAAAGPVSGLNANQRQHAREMIAQAALLCLHHAAPGRER